MAIYEKRVSVGQFLKKGTDFKDGELLEVANEGKEVIGEFGPQNVFLVKLPTGQEGNVKFNQTTLNGLIDAYGKNSLDWVGKKVKALKIKQNVAGKFMDVWYYSHPDAELTKDGFVMPSSKPQAPNDEVNVEDIPF